MKFLCEELNFSTEGNADIIELTEKVQALIYASGMRNGLVNIFVPGATGALTTLEHEPGVCKDFQELFDFIAPRDKDYHHNRREVDSNGHSHVRAGLLGPSLTIPFKESHLLLGRWQQIVFIDFDEVARDRHLFVTMLGE